MLPLVALAVLLGCTNPAAAEDKKVTVTFLGGAKKARLEGLKVSIRSHTGDWSDDRRRKPLADGKTGKDGAAAFALAPGRYYVDIESDKELPYLYLPVGHKGPTSIYDRVITVGNETAFEFNLADACRLTLRAVDADTGEGVPGVELVTENALGEYWAETITGDNLGAGQARKGKQEEGLKTDKDGNFIRFMGPRPGWTYYVWSVPKGYEVPEAFGEVELKTPLGTETVEHGACPVSCVRG
jgi:hypothetical protein